MASAPRGLRRGERRSGLVNGGTDAYVGAAAADVARHGGVDIRLARLRISAEQRRGRNDLPALAVAALRHVERDPGLLHRLAGGRREPLDGGDALAGDGRYRGDARARRLTVD